MDVARRPGRAYSRHVLGRDVLFAIVLVVAALCASSASAQEETPEEAAARQHFEDGRLAFAEGRSEVALDEFRAAYDISHRPELLYNIGLVEDRLRHDREALEAFRGYLAAVPGAENRPSVESRIRVLEQSIAQEDALAEQATHTTDTPAETQSGDDVWSSPILWVVVGVVVVGAGVGVGVGVAASQDPGTAAVMPGPSGVVVQALSLSF